MARTVVVAGAIAAAVPLLLSSFYLYRLHSRVASQTTRSKGQLSSSSSKTIAPKSLPAHIASDPDAWIIHYERVVSHSNPVSTLVELPGQQLSDQEPSRLLQSYIRSSHYAFSRTPQAFILGRFIKDPDAKRTFTPGYIKTLDFRLGQRVNGAYTVVYIGEGHVEGSERIELALDAPKGYKGPAPQGRIISEILPAKNGKGSGEDEQVVFVNETWMWRKPSERKTLLEGKFGAWIHALTSGWLILNGLESVRRPQDLPTHKKHCCM